MSVDIHCSPRDTEYDYFNTVRQDTSDAVLYKYRVFAMANTPLNYDLLLITLF